MNTTYTIHALNRYYERFPNCPITIYQALEESIPYGRQTNSTKVTIHPKHNIIFIIDKTTPTPTLKTVLTQHLYIANAQANTHTTHHTHTPIHPPTPTTPTPDPKEKEQSNKERLKEQLQEKQEKEQEIKKQIETQASEYAKLKNYEPWCKEFREEAKTKYTITRKNMQHYFIPYYHRECSYYNVFKTEENTEPTKG